MNKLQVKHNARIGDKEQSSSWTDFPKEQSGKISPDNFKMELYQKRLCDMIA